MSNTEKFNTPHIEISAETQKELTKYINEWKSELKNLLPSLPENIDITFNNYWLIPGYGTGGFAMTKNRIELAFDPEFKGDKNKQITEFKGSFFHEMYHIAQGFVGEDDSIQDISMLDNAIYEGAATKFEMLRAGTNPGWGQYAQEDIQDWVKEIAQVTDYSEYERWKFFDPQTNRRWIAYRVGCYIIDQALEHNPDLQIEDLVEIKPGRILDLSRVNTF